MYKYIVHYIFRLHDVLHSEKKLTLVFEYCDQDLKKYFDSCNGEIDQDTVQVSYRYRFLCVKLTEITCVPGKQNLTDPLSVLLDR